MNKDLIENYEPKQVWSYFEQINAVPRASKKEEKIISWVENFARSINLPYKKDAAGNICIKKKAQNSTSTQKIVLQSHLDMVHQKNQSKTFDFETQGIESIFIDDNKWLKANGTTLGADNGIGVASMLAVLADKEMSHPQLECLFTIDEETGMTGAHRLESGFVEGDVLLNLDTEDDDELTVGCAGGIDIYAKKDWNATIDKNENTVVFDFTIKKLLGGHSGADIHLGRGNAIKILTRVLNNLPFKLCLGNIKGGNLRNVIPREATATILIDKKDISSWNEHLDKWKNTLNSEYSFIEKEVELNSVENKDFNQKFISFEDTKSILDSLEVFIYGVFRYSNVMPEMVETSCNLSFIKVENKKLDLGALLRGNVESTMKNLESIQKKILEKYNYIVKFSNKYPGWQPQKDTKLIKTTTKCYKDLFDEDIKIKSIHAGLECGLILSKYSHMEAISFGPNIKNAHSPDEKVEIASVQKFWTFFTTLLKII